MARTSFNPVQHGFKFRNQFVNHLVTVPDLGIDIATNGRCGGMAFAALDYWHHKLAPPEDAQVPVDGTLVSGYIYERLLNSIVANAFKYFHFMRTPDNPTWLNGIGVARATREEEFPKIRQLIDQGQPCALGLTQARNIGEFSNDHQVVVYGYEVGEPYSTLFVYDNNHPGEEIRVTFKTAYDPGEREIRHSKNSVWRGFFVEQYAPQLPYYLADGSLLSELSQDAIHVVRGGGRFWIPSPQEFDANGLSWDAVRETANDSMRHVSTYPANGTLLRERGGTVAYVVHGGFAFGIPSQEVFDALGLRWESLRQIPAGSLTSLRQFPADGTILKELSDSAVYVAEQGVLRHIPSPQEFDNRGFTWGNLSVVPDGTLAPLPKGPPLPSTVPEPTPMPRSWAEYPRGTILTADGDQIQYTVEPGVVGNDEVRFCFSVGPGITWRKELVLVADDGRWTVTVEGPGQEENNGLYRSQLPNGSLLFRKAKLFGIVTDVHSVGNLDQLPAGANVSFTWMRD